MKAGEIWKGKHENSFVKLISYTGNDLWLCAIKIENSHKKLVWARGNVNLRGESIFKHYEKVFDSLEEYNENR